MSKYIWSKQIFELFEEVLEEKSSDNYVYPPTTNAYPCVFVVNVKHAWLDVVVY